MCQAIKHGIIFQLETKRGWLSPSKSSSVTSIRRSAGAHAFLRSLDCHSRRVSFTVTIPPKTFVSFKNMTPLLVSARRHTKECIPKSQNLVLSMTDFQASTKSYTKMTMSYEFPLGFFIQYYFVV